MRGKSMLEPSDHEFQMNRWRMTGLENSLGMRPEEMGKIKSIYQDQSEFLSVDENSN